jgi:hypothetical protein
MLGRWVAKLVVPDISQKYQMGDKSKVVGNTFWPAKNLQKKEKKKKENASTF